MNIKNPTMRVLLIQYSLSGDTNKATEEFLRGFQQEVNNNGDGALEICRQPIQIEPSFSFPWKFWKFFDVMPETVWVNSPYRSCYRVVEPSSSLLDDSNAFDLIVLGWQTWYLSPSLPVQLALENPKYQQLLSSSKHGVVLIGTHRNMWHHASQVLSKSLRQQQNMVIGRINFVQSSAFLTSVVQTLRRQLLGVEGGIGSTTAKDDAYQEGKLFAQHFSENCCSNNNKGPKEEKQKQSEASVAVYQGGKPFNSILSFCEEVWFPLKKTAGKVMGCYFPPGSLGRKIVATLYIPVLLSAIVGLAPPILLVGSALKAIRAGGGDKSADDDGLKKKQS